MSTPNHPQRHPCVCGDPTPHEHTYDEACEILSRQPESPPSRYGWTHTSHWRPGDVVIRGETLWRVREPLQDHPDWVVVERLFRADDSVMNVTCGHAYPPDHELWRDFERLVTATERVASQRKEPRQ